MKQVVLGLSGGVDSAVAASILKSEGYDVLGVFLDIGNSNPSDAAEIADFLGIDFEVRDISRTLEENVCKPFVSAYLAGETPNPCILCNPSVKFPALLSAADEHGIHHVATGHYARTVFEDGYFRLLKGTSANDQSYMLSRLDQTILSRLLLPLGNLEKSEIRQLAEKLGLKVAQKPDSMEICFIPDNDYISYIESRAGKLPGEFVDENNNVLGLHDGIYRYTIGQRRGLNIAAGRRIFVKDIDPVTNRVVLGDGEELFRERLFLPKLHWVSSPPSTEPLNCSVKVRHSKFETPAKLVPDTCGGAELLFEKPVRAPTPGQTAAIYAGDVLIASGEIKKE